MTDREKRLDQLRDLAVEYLYGEMAPEQEAAFVQEVKQTPELAAEFEQLVNLKSRLDVLESPQPPPDVVADIMRLAEESCAPAARSKSPSMLAEWLYWLTRPQVGMGLAAVLVIAVGLWVTREVQTPTTPGSAKSIEQQFRAAAPEKVSEKATVAKADEKLEDVEKSLAQKAGQIQPATLVKEPDQAPVETEASAPAQEEEKKAQAASDSGSVSAVSGLEDGLAGDRAGRKEWVDRGLLTNAAVGPNLDASNEDAPAPEGRAEYFKKANEKSPEEPALKLKKEKVAQEKSKREDKAYKARKLRTAADVAAEEKNKAPVALLSKMVAKKGAGGGSTGAAAAQRKRDTSGGEDKSVDSVLAPEAPERKKEEVNAQRGQAESGVLAGATDARKPAYHEDAEDLPGTDEDRKDRGLPVAVSTSRVEKKAETAKLEAGPLPVPVPSDGVAMQGEHPQPHSEPLARAEEDAGVDRYQSSSAGPAPQVPEHKPETASVPAEAGDAGVADSSRPPELREEAYRSKVAAKKTASREEEAQADDLAKEQPADPLAYCAKDWEEIEKMQAGGKNNAALYLLRKFRDGPCKTRIAQSKLDLMEGRLLLAMKRKAEARRSLEKARKANDDPEASEKAATMIDSMK